MEKAFDDVSLRLLYGKATEIPEVDSEQLENNEIDAMFYYTAYLFTESIGKENFEDNYYLFINDVKNQDVDNIKIILNRSLNKIDEVYDFVFSEEIELNSLEERTWLMDFIKFIEFDNLEFLKNLYNDLDVDFDNIKRVKQYLKNNKNDVLFSIQSLNMIYSYNKLILDFLINYNGDNLIDWIIKQSEKHKIELYIQNKEKE